MHDYASWKVSGARITAVKNLPGIIAVMRRQGKNASASVDPTTWSMFFFPVFGGTEKTTMWDIIMIMRLLAWACVCVCMIYFYNARSRWYDVGLRVVCDVEVCEFGKGARISRWRSRRRRVLPGLKKNAVFKNYFCAYNSSECYYVWAHFFRPKCIPYYIFIYNDPLTFKICLYYARSLSTLNAQCPFHLQAIWKHFWSVDQMDEIQKKKNASVNVIYWELTQGRIQKEVMGAIAPPVPVVDFVTWLFQE